MLSGGEPNGGVQVIPRSGNEIPYPNCLVVEPYRDAARGDNLFASVEHYAETENPSGFPWKILPVTDDPQPFKNAMELAMAYAQRSGVPVILVNHDSMSSEAERQQTDTTILKVGVSGTGS
ncbi:MAG: hypothetical protein GWN29_07255 [Gammaproteobacteria bacterium]|nr:hypothetical protein [Gammaproteobacteria bacterium]